MAKVVAGVLTAGLSGRAGNAVFVRKSDGEVGVRQWVVPHDTQTPPQLA